MSDPRVRENFDLFRGTSSPEPKVPAHQASSETSKAAALRIQPKASGLRYEVLSVIVDAGEAGLTRREIEQVTGMLTQTVTPRLNELEQSGEIRKLTYLGDDRQVHTVKRENCAVYVVNRRVA